MANLYQLATEYNDLFNALMDSADVETGEVDVDISAALEKVQGTFAEKAVATATVFRMLGGESEKIKAEIDRLTKLKTHIDKEQERVKSYLVQACEMTGTESLRGIYASISFRTSKQTIIDNADILPAEFVKVETTYKPDKKAIKAAIDAGRDVTGAHIETVRNIQIK
ncbi:MAG: siphovirus Gp157 family protein [Muribaculaceae bacterium]|nr:siphovirus Gp157 family protein [Muribaculaceae bacterium]